MTIRALTCLVLVLVLAGFAPLAVAADPCPDCLSGAGSGCCPPACGACSCCGQSAALAISSQIAPAAVPAGPVAERLQGALPLSHPRTVFHVPKSTS